MDIDKEYERREALYQMQVDLQLKLLEADEINRVMYGIASGAVKSMAKATKDDERFVLESIHLHYGAKSLQSQRTGLVLRNNRHVLLTRLLDMQNAD